VNGETIHHSYPSSAATPLAPAAVTAKYLVGDVIGDGNFAVVRRYDF